MNVEFNKNLWIKEDIINLIFIICMENYAEEMYERHGIHPDKNVLKTVDKFRKQFDLRKMGLGYMHNEDFAEVIMGAIISKIKNVETVEELPQIIENLNDEGIMKDIMGGLYQINNEEYPEDAIDIDRGNLREVMDFLCKINVNKEIKWDVYKFLINPQELFQKIAEGVRLITPKYLKEMSKFEKHIEEINKYVEEKIEKEGNNIFLDVFEGGLELENYKKVTIGTSYINSKSLVSRVGKDELTIIVGFQVRETLKEIRGKDEQESMLNLIRVITDPVKFKILTYTKEKAAYGKELCKLTGLSKAALSYHLSQLINIGALKYEKKGNRIYYLSRRDNIVDTVGKFLENIK